MKDYGKNIFFRLIKIHCFEKFKIAITNELEKLGFCDWSYAQLDIPLKFASERYIGTISTDHKRIYMSEEFYRHDLLMQHIKDSYTNIFLSDIVDLLEASKIKTEQFRRNEEIIKLNVSMGYKNTFCMTVGERHEKNRGIFSVTAKGAASDCIKASALKNRENLIILGKIINDVGVINFPDIFISENIENLCDVYSTEFNALVTSVKYDLSAKETAHKLGIRQDSVNGYLASVRGTLGAKTNAGAFAIAIRDGLIDYDYKFYK